MAGLKKVRHVIRISLVYIALSAVEFSYGRTIQVTGVQNMLYGIKFVKTRPVATIECYHEALVLAGTVGALKIGQGRHFFK